MLVIEEADESGHAISCAEINEAFLQETTLANWVEIGRKEWMRNFEAISCYECGVVFKDTGKVVPTEKGLVHELCFARVAKERGPQNVVVVH